MTSTLVILFLTFALSFVASLALTPAIGAVAVRFGVVDMPGPRKIHTMPTPRLGGVSLYLACLAPIIMFYVLYGFGQELMTKLLDANFFQLYVLIVASGGILVLGVVDDVRGLRPWSKLLVEIGAGLFLYFTHIRISYLSNPFGGDVIDLGWLAPVATVAWVVVVTNAINLLDGIDGLAAGVSAFVALTLCVRCLQSGSLLSAMLALGVAGAAIGFLRYNFFPARIFLGDSGSLFLGFFLSALALKAFMKGPTAGAILIPMVALGVPIWDSLITVTRRALDGKSPFSADDGHVHHRLLYWGLTQRQVALTLYGATVLLCAAAMALMFLKRGEAVLILAMLGAFGYVTSRWLGAQLPRLRMTGTFEGNVIDRLEAKLTAEEDEERRWQMLCSACDTLDIVTMSFVRSDTEEGKKDKAERSWQVAEPSSDAVLSMPVEEAGSPVGRLTVGWAAGDLTGRECSHDVAERIGTLFARCFVGPKAQVGPAERETTTAPNVEDNQTEQ